MATGLTLMDRFRRIAAERRAAGYIDYSRKVEDVRVTITADRNTRKRLVWISVDPQYHIEATGVRAHRDTVVKSVARAYDLAIADLEEGEADRGEVR